jgi:hypothetical protein
MLGNFDELVERQSLDRRPGNLTAPDTGVAFLLLSSYGTGHKSHTLLIKGQLAGVSACAVDVTYCLAEVCLPEARFVERKWIGGPCV